MLKEEFVPMVLVDRQDAESVITLVVAKGEGHGSYGGALIELGTLLTAKQYVGALYGSIEKRFKL